MGDTPATQEHWMPAQAPIFEPRELNYAVVAPNMVAPFQPPRNETIAPEGELTVSVRYITRIPGLTRAGEYGWQPPMRSAMKPTTRNRRSVVKR